ncbi:MULTISPECIES: ABC transporter permease [Pseudonocardia]|uniref:Transport permease protein n=2 Tax=Pseudonocardia TaxID=1847 RepID=A0A1Y2MRB1_PSEAH|nr:MULTISPECIES: ABC transporter permease [Pseudonocardia]OSY37742.1 Daunorubicin/doxorubicin resistance ABC transporter permease protein DrrB [Pseudonocardia autotrophica]TDN75768.1 oleandomycin transport system permease protein [Pseudonocardia autotrophica]BBF99739.1 transport permease protein [Pseudonocardia autotrophica]GEC27170.1 transport permease protein [Pseudonocardia saturnea]
MTATLTEHPPTPGPTAPAAARRSWVPAPLRHSAALARRGLIKTIHSPEALLDVTLQPIIFLLLFVYVFGGAIAGSSDDYLQYALPGVLLQTVVFASAGTGVGLAEDLKTGIFDRFRSLPISRAAPLVGAVGADLVRYITSGVIMLAFGFALGYRTSAGPLAVLGAFGLVVLFAFAMCWIFTALGVVSREPRSVQGISAMIMLPLTFASSVFVPVETMPDWLRPFAEVNPVSRCADAVRALLAGEPAAAATTASLVTSAIVVAIFAPLAVTLYRRRT